MLAGRFTVVCPDLGATAGRRSRWFFFGQTERPAERFISADP
jgi:hypothetical protein